MPHEIIAHQTQLKRFLMKDELNQLSQFLVLLMLHDNTDYLKLMNRASLGDLLKQFDVKPDVIKWLVSLQCESIQSMAQCITNHNRMLLIRLTQS